MKQDPSELRQKVMDEIKPYEAPSVTLGKMKYKVNTFVINIATLIKISLSNYPADEELDFPALVGDLRGALVDLAEGISDYHKNMRSSAEMAVIVYYNDYAHVPDTFKRQLAQLDKAEEIVSYIRKQPNLSKTILEDMDAIFQHRGQGEQIHIWGVINDPQVRSMPDVFRVYKIASEIKGLISVLFISNFPIDYHTGYEFYVLDSFTGNLWTEVTLSEKLFDDVSIPFTEETHILFGDRTLIKPLLHHGSKAAVLNKIRSLPKYQVNKTTIVRAMDERDPLLNAEMRKRKQIFL